VVHAGRFRSTVAVALGLAFVVSACTERETPPVARAESLRPAPEVSPIERLGRWDGTTFTPVAPGSVASGDLYVLVHGWAPGYLAAVRRARGPIPLLAWSPRAVNAQGQGMFTDFLPLAAAIARDDPTATILGFSWLDDAATALSPFDAWKSEARTDLNGQRLAAALGQVLAPGFATDNGRTHLIGHSHGAKVATVAAIALERPPEQLTLLDSPEDALASLPGAANHLDGYLPLLPIGRGPGRTFVDNYFSITGERYGTFPALEAVVDVRLDPAQYGDLTIDNLIARHGYPVEWYARSAEDPAAGVGFAWSPLIGTPPACIACFFRQDWVGPDGEVDRAEELRLQPVRVTVRRAHERRPLEVRPLRGPSSTLRPNGVVISAPGRRVWQFGFDHRGDDIAIEFDVRFTAPGAGAQLAVFLDERQVATTSADWAGATGHHMVVDVSTLDRGRHTMTAVLTPPTNRREPARVILGGFVVVSEPGAASPGEPLSTEAKLALLALVLFAIIAVMAGVLRRRDRTRVSP